MTPSETLLIIDSFFCNTMVFVIDYWFGHLIASLWFKTNLFVMAQQMACEVCKWLNLT